MATRSSRTNSWRRPLTFVPFYHADPNEERRDEKQITGPAQPDRIRRRDMASSPIVRAQFWNSGSEYKIENEGMRRSIRSAIKMTKTKQTQPAASRLCRDRFWVFKSASDQHEKKQNERLISRSPDRQSPRNSTDDAPFTAIWSDNWRWFLLAGSIPRKSRLSPATSAAIDDQACRVPFHEREWD